MNRARQLAGAHNFGKSAVVIYLNVHSNNLALVKSPAGLENLTKIHRDLEPIYSRNIQPVQYSCCTNQYGPWITLPVSSASSR
jgi:hypothetical protein